MVHMSGFSTVSRPSFRDFLAYVPTLRGLAADGAAVPDEDVRKRLAELVRVTLKWQNTSYRSWERAVACRSELGDPGREEEELREALVLSAKVCVQCLACHTDWAAECLALLVDDFEDLFNKRVATTSYSGTSSYWSTGTGGYTNTASYMNQEGAVSLRGVAALAFAGAGGYDALAATLLASTDSPSTLSKLVELLGALSQSREQPDKACMDECCTAAGEALSHIPEQILVDKRESMLSAIRQLLQISRPLKDQPKPLCRAAIEGAWKSLIAAGLRSTNLQARRAAADELGEAKKRGFTPAELAPWLRSEGVLQELFGDRVDARVLEELTLEPLCEPTTEGLRAFLAELEPLGLGHSVLFKKLHGFAIFSPHDTQPPKWGRDMVVVEVMDWARRLAAGGRAEAVAFISGFVSYTLRIVGQGEAQHRIFDFVANPAALAVFEAVSAAIVAPSATKEQLVRLEAAFVDGLLHKVGPDFRLKLLARMVAEVEAAACEDGALLSLAQLRFFRLTLQAFPVSAGRHDDGPSREKALQAHGGVELPERLFLELGRFLASGDASTEAVQWRLRMLCFVHRCLNNKPIDESRLEVLVRLLKPIDQGLHLCYFLRIALTTPRPEEKDSTQPALSEGALRRALELLEQWAIHEGGLNLAAFYCLQQAIVLVNGRQGNLRLVSADGNDVSPDSFAGGGVVALTESTEMKGPLWQMVGRWVVVQQDAEHNMKIGRLGKFDDITETFDIEYLDEMVHRRRLQYLTRWRFVPPLLEQEPCGLTARPARDAAELAGLAGLKGLWACALGAREAQRAAELLLALHQGPNGTQTLLDHLYTELGGGVEPAVVGRGVALFQTLVSKEPLAQRRAHLSRGYPLNLSLVEYNYEEVKATGAYYSGPTTVRRQVGAHSLKAHSQQTVEELHVLAAACLGRKQVKLLRGGKSGDQLASSSQQTLEEVGLIGGSQLEAEAVDGAGTEKQFAVLARVVSSSGLGPLDRLGEGDSRWLEKLLDFLGNCPGLGAKDRELCWKLLMRLPTHETLHYNVKQPAGQDWGTSLSTDNFWRSAYTILIIDAVVSPLRDGYATPEEAAPCVMKPEEIERWLESFATAGGVEAMLSFFVRFTGVSDGGMHVIDDFELTAVLPPLVRAVGACVLGCGRREALGVDNGNSLCLAAARATRWLFDKSKECTISTVRIRLRHAAADGLHLLVEAQRRAALALETVDGLVLPLLLDIARGVEGHVNARVAGAIVEVSRRPGTAPLLLRRLASAVMSGVVGGGCEAGPLFEVALVALRELGEQVAAEAGDAQRELSVAVAKGILSSRHNIASLFRLFAALLERSADAPPELVEGETAGRLADRLLVCVLPEVSKPLDDDSTREQATAALLCLVGVCKWPIRGDVLRKVVAYLAQTPTPSSFDFEPSAPKEPSTRLDAARNESGHVGLQNRGMTCYMNSTVQQLFWAHPFRTAVLSAPPPVPQAPDKPQPLPDAAKGRGTKKKQPEPTAADVGWQIQRLFCYAQDCLLGQYDTDALVNACKCLHLEYAVTSQNDAAEFFDKVCDAVDAVCSIGSEPHQRPGSVFATKTCREKHCLNCGLRTRGQEDELRRVQLNVLKPTMEECLEELTAAETMSGDNRVDCDRCGPKRDTRYQTFFTQLPQILVLNLARITFDLETLERVKRNPRIEFPMRINMSQFTEDAIVHGLDSVPGCTYELQGVQVHMGGAGSGHYYSFAQDTHGKWYKFNDDRVSAFDLSHMEEECFGGEDQGTYSSREKSYNAYMLYYRCVDASPYRARSERPATPAHQTAATDDSPSQPHAILRSISASTSLYDGQLKPPPLLRTATQAFDGERLVERQRRRTQALMRSELVEEINSVNTRLQRHAAVFSIPAEALMLKLVTSLTKELSGESAPSQDKLPAVVQGLSQLTAKVLFDVVLHGRGVDEKRLRPWVDVLCQQMTANPGSARWLLAGLAGAPDSALGRSPCAWLHKLLFQCQRYSERIEMAVIIVPAALEAAAATETERSACGHFFEALLGTMASVRGLVAIARYGEMWERLTGSATLLPLLLAHKGAHGSPISSLLLHLYLGKGNSPLPAPPAPALPEHGLDRSFATTQPTGALLEAVGKLLVAEPALTSEAIVTGEPLWRALARRNPEMLVKEPFRCLLPDDFGVQRSVAQAIIEALRPTACEDPDFAMALVDALTMVLAAGGAERQTEKLSVLCVVGQDLLAAAHATMKAPKTSFGTTFGVGTSDASRRLNSRRPGISIATFDDDAGGTGGTGVGVGTGMDDLELYGESLESKRVRFNSGDIADVDEILSWSKDDTATQTWSAKKDKVSGFSYSHGPKNPDALQLLRVLQAVSKLEVELPETWVWARDWLAEVVDRKAWMKWRTQGVPLEDAKAVRAALRGPGGLAVECGAESEGGSRELIQVRGAGTRDADGDYTFAYDDDSGCPHYENKNDPSLVLLQQKDRWGDIRWIIQREGGALLYETKYQYVEQVESPYPPLSADEWQAQYDASPPSPSLAIIVD